MSATPARPVVPDLASAHRENRALTHKAGANFSVGFRFLPKERRRAVYAA